MSKYSFFPGYYTIEEESENTHRIALTYTHQRIPLPTCPQDVFKIMQFSGIFSQILGSSHPHLESKLCPPDQNPGSAPAVYLCPQMCEKSQQTQKQKSLKQKRLSVISHRTLPRSLPFQVSWNHPGILPCVRFKTKSKSICFHRRSWKKGPTCVLS